MRRLLLAGTALAFAGPAFAADLPARMPVKAPMVAPIAPFAWTGCYVGGHIGAGASTQDVSEPTGPFGPFLVPANDRLRVDKSSFLGGGQVGCDYQFAANWVIGAAGDFSWTDINGQTTDPFFAGKNPGPITFSAKTEWLATATGRIGYAWDRVMVYGKGGAAWAHDKYSVGNLFAWGNPNASLCFSGAAFAACNPTGTETRTGWTVGVGFEWAFADNWSTALEFDHYDFGTKRVTLTDPNGFSFVTLGAVAVSGPVDVKQRIEAVKFSINYRFNWGAPVSARY
jgi:outer membrane immunogenic protein